MRLLRRTGKELTALGTDVLRGNPTSGTVRISLGQSDGVAVSGERSQEQCQLDGSGRSLTEDIKLDVTNDGTEAAEVVVREAMYRAQHWKIVKESVKGVRADDHAQEWRLKIPAGDSRSVSFTVKYDW